MRAPQRHKKFPGGGDLSHRPVVFLVKGGDGMEETFEQVYAAYGEMLYRLAAL